MRDSGKIKKDANKLEKELASFLGGQRVPASGAIKSMKGDIRTDQFLLDSKNTEKNTIILSSADLVKIYKEAGEAGKTGHLVLTFLEHSEHWAVVPYKDVDFDSTEVTLLAKGSKGISRSVLSSATKKAIKAKKEPSIKITFEKMQLGVPRTWLIIPIEKYKQEFLDG